MTTPAPGPTAGLMPTAQAYPSATAAPQAAGQNIAGNVNQFAAGGAASGNVFLGNAQAQTMRMFPRNGPNETVYSVYDPNAIVPITGSGVGPVYVDLNSATNMYYQWSQQQQNAFRARYALVDTTALQATDAQMANAWASLVNQSAAYGAAGQQVSPWDILAKDIASNGGGKGKAGKDFSRTISTEATTSRPDANAVFTAAAQSLLGRAPTADELSGFYNNLHSLELANPLVKTINYHYLPGQSFYPSEDITKQTGGVSQAAQQNLALQQAKENPEYGAYQASTTYMGALQELLSGGKV